MDNVTFIKVTGINDIETEHAIVENADGSQTSMTKAHYEAQQAEHFTPKVAGK
jgi:hypothetical protein